MNVQIRNITNNEFYLIMLQVRKQIEDRKSYEEVKEEEFEYLSKYKPIPKLEVRSIKIKEEANEQDILKTNELTEHLLGNLDIDLDLDISNILAESISNIETRIIQDKYQQTEEEQVLEEIISKVSPQGVEEELELDEDDLDIELELEDLELDIEDLELDEKELELDVEDLELDTEEDIEEDIYEEEEDEIIVEEEDDEEDTEEDEEDDEEEDDEEEIEIKQKQSHLKQKLKEVLAQQKEKVPPKTEGVLNRTEEVPQKPKGVPIKEPQEKRESKTQIKPKETKALQQETVKINNKNKVPELPIDKIKNKNRLTAIERLKDDYKKNPSSIPRDVKTLVQKYRGIKFYEIADTFISKKELQRAIDKGEVIRRNDRLW